MRVTGTRSAIASALEERPSGFMNSSRSISPGCKAGIRAPILNAGSVVVGNLNFVGIALTPLKAYSELIVDSQAPLALPVPLQSLQPVSRRRTHFLYR